MRKILSIAVLGLSLGGIVGCGEEPIPDFPSWQKDLLPFFEARCVRCHGAGGTLNNDPYMGPNTAGKAGVARGTPTAFYANVYDMDASTTPPRLGAKTLNALIAPYMTAKVANDDQARMPPYPAPKLTDREMSLVNRWIATNMPP